jgi:hypothetical protein
LKQGSREAALHPESIGSITSRGQVIDEPALAAIRTHPKVAKFFDKAYLSPPFPLLIISSSSPTLLLSTQPNHRIMVLQTKLTKLVGIRHPIVQGGMQWVSDLTFIAGMVY